MSLFKIRLINLSTKGERARAREEAERRKGKIVLEKLQKDVVLDTETGEWSPTIHSLIDIRV